MIVRLGGASGHGSGAGHKRRHSHPRPSRRRSRCTAPKHIDPAPAGRQQAAALSGSEACAVRQHPRADDRQHRPVPGHAGRRGAARPLPMPAHPLESAEAELDLPPQGAPAGAGSGRATVRSVGRACGRRSPGRPLSQRLVPATLPHRLLGGRLGRARRGAGLAQRHLDPGLQEDALAHRLWRQAGDRGLFLR